MCPDRPIGGVLSPFASLSTASPGFTSKPHIPKFINKSAEEERRGEKKKKLHSSSPANTRQSRGDACAQEHEEKGFEKESKPEIL